MTSGTRGLLRPGVIGATAATAAVLAGVAYQEASAARDRHRFPPPGRLVDIGGRDLHLLEAGEGAPAVVILAALGDGILGWMRIQRALAAEMKVCTYDRAGLGWSDPAPRGRRTLDDMADELRTLLDRAGVEPPFILAAHSLGGIVARRLAVRHSGVVAGIVLVDSSHEDQVSRRRRGGMWLGSATGTRWQAVRRLARPASLRRAAVALGLDRELGADAAREVPPEHAAEYRAVALSSRNRRAVVRELLLAATLGGGRPPSLGSMPLTVITADRDDPDWMQMQCELAASSSRSTHATAVGCGHYVHRDDPDLVLQAIRDMARRVTPGHRL